MCETYWNGERCTARKVRVVVDDFREGVDPPLLWWRDFAGEEREAVEVIYRGEVFYLDNEALPEDFDRDKYIGELPEAERRRIEALKSWVGEVKEAPLGWEKVTLGKGSPWYGHRSLRIREVVL